jgi:hypothetical protein
VVAIVGSAIAWGLAALPLGLWATQGCFGGDPASGTLCPSGRYLEAGLRLYWLTHEHVSGRMTRMGFSARTTEQKLGIRSSRPIW